MSETPGVTGAPVSGETIPLTGLNLLLVSRGLIERQAALKASKASMAALLGMRVKLIAVVPSATLTFFPAATALRLDDPGGAFLMYVDELREVDGLTICFFRPFHRTTRVVVVESPIPDAAKLLAEFTTARNRLKHPQGTRP